jgi:hypothetical protein
MMIAKNVAYGCALLAGLTFATATAMAGKHCVRAAGSATAITKEVATLLAKESLYQSNVMAGRKGRGATNVSCKYQGIVTTCRATQVACK